MTCAGLQRNTIGEALRFWVGTEPIQLMNVIVKANDCFANVSGLYNACKVREHRSPM